MAAPFISRSNWADAGSYSGGSWTAGLPLADPADRQVQKVARSSSAAKVNAQFDLDLGGLQPVSAIALVNHNLSQDAKWRVRLGVESVTNRLFRSNDLSASPWTTGNAVVAAPIVTGNAATAPNGLAEATLVQLPAVQNTGERSFVIQQRSIGAPFPASNLSCWLKGVAGGEVVYLQFVAGGGVYDTQWLACTLTTDWRRFDLPFSPVDPTSHGANAQIGVDLQSGSGQSARAAQSFYAWGAQVTTGMGVQPLVKSAGGEATATIPEAGGPYDSLFVDVWPSVVPFGSLDWGIFLWGQQLSAAEAAALGGYAVLLPAGQVNARYCRVEFDDTANADGFVEAGRFVLADRFQPVHGQRLGWQQQTLDPSRVTESRGGQRWFDVRAKRRRVDLTFQALSRLERDVVDTVDRIVGISGDVLFIPDPADTANLFRDTVLGTLTELPPFVQQHFGRSSAAAAIRAERYGRRFVLEESI